MVHKKEMDNIENKVDKYRSLLREELYNLKKEQKDLCCNSKECSDEMDEHIKICVVQ